MANIEEFFEPKKKNPLPVELTVSKQEAEKSIESEKSSGSKTPLAIAIIIAIAALGLAGFFYWKSNNAEKNIKAQETACQESIKQAQEAVMDNQSKEELAKEETPKEEPKAAEEIVKVSVAVYNGTKITGLAKSLGEKVASVSGVEIVSTVNAKKDYTKNIIINLAKVNSETVQKIADKIGAEVGEMPAGETKPNADVLIIGGKSVN